MAMTDASPRSVKLVTTPRAGCPDEHHPVVVVGRDQQLRFGSPSCGSGAVTAWPGGATSTSRWLPSPGATCACSTCVPVRHDRHDVPVDVRQGGHEEPDRPDRPPVEEVVVPVDADFLATSAAGSTAAIGQPGGSER